MNETKLNGVCVGKSVETSKRKVTVRDETKKKLVYIYAVVLLWFLVEIAD